MVWAPASFESWKIAVDIIQMRKPRNKFVHRAWKAELSLKFAVVPKAVQWKVAIAHEGWKKIVPTIIKFPFERFSSSCKWKFPQIYEPSSLNAMRVHHVELHDGSRSKWSGNVNYLVSSKRKIQRWLESIKVINRARPWCHLTHKGYTYA